MRTPDHTHARIDAEEKKAQEGGGIDGWAWAHPPSRAAQGVSMDVMCATDGSHHHILYRYNPLYHGIPHAHMRTRTTHAHAHAHARPRDGAFDGHRTRAMDTKNIKQKSALFGGARGATKAPGPRTGEPWTRQRPWRPWRTAAAPVVDAVVVVVVVVRTTRARDVNQRHDASGR